MKILVIIACCLLAFQAQTQIFHTDIRGTNDNTDGGMFQLATPSVTNYLRLFSGRVGDPKPFLYFSGPDTFRIASGNSDFSSFRENLTILNGYSTNGSSTTFTGINNPQPASELDIRTNDPDDGAEIRVANSDNSHFLKFFSGRQNQFAYPSMYWRNGDSLSLGTDANGYTEILRLRTDGTMNLNSNKGIALDAGDRPLITRGWDKFISGPNAGIGRWGVFMEPLYLTFGMPNIPARGFQFVTYDDDGTIAETQMRLKEGKLGINNLDPQHLLDVNGDVNLTGTLNLNGDSGTAGQVLTSNGNSAPSWTVISSNPQVGFKAYLSSTISVPNFLDTSLVAFAVEFDEGNNFNATTGEFVTPSSGFYHFTFKTVWSTPGPTYSEIPVLQRIAVNGLITAQVQAKVSLNTSYGEAFLGSYDFKLNQGDVITFLVNQISGATLELFANGSVPGDTTVSGFKVY